MNKYLTNSATPATGAAASSATPAKSKKHNFLTSKRGTSSPVNLEVNNANTESASNRGTWD